MNKSDKEKIEELLKPIAEEGLKNYGGTEKIFDLSIAETALQEAITFGRESKCSCGEPHISDMVVHCYDGSPCYLKERSNQ